MKTLLKIAWRNVWRNKLRSLVVITSIVLGIWAGLVVSGFSYGLNEQRTQNTIRDNLSHLQIHDQKWADDQKLTYWIEDERKVQKHLASADWVQDFAARVKVSGMIASAHYTSGIQLIGINPEAEAQLTQLSAKVDSGEYLNGEGRNPVLIGKALADKLKAKPGSKLVLTFTDEEGNIVSGAFKVRGIYDAASSQQEKMVVYVRSGDLLNLLGRQKGVHEFALFLKDAEKLEQYKEALQAQFPGLLIESWKDLSPELSFADELMSTMLYIIIGIIMLALCFGIINTMLMAVLERRKELGMLMGVGMSKSRVFFMIIFETLMLSLCGGPLGILLGFITIELTQHTGLDLSAYSAGLESYGIETIIYPAVETSFYFGTTALVMIVSLVAAIWPARRALKLNPVEAIRTI